MKLLCVSNSLLFAFMAACTFTIDAPSEPFRGYDAAPPLDISVTLELSEELCSAEIVKQHMGDTWIIPIGPNLCMNAEELARTLFRTVEVVHALDVVAPGATDATLTPALAYGSFGNVSSLVTLTLEWTLHDAAGKPVWGGTVSGDGTGRKVRLTPTDAVEEAVDELFKKSHETLATAREIRAFAERE